MFEELFQKKEANNRPQKLSKSSSRRVDFGYDLHQAGEVWNFSPVSPVI